MDNPSGNFAFWNGNLIFFSPGQSSVTRITQNSQLRPSFKATTTFPKQEWNEMCTHHSLVAIQYSLKYVIVCLSFLFFFFSSKYCLTTLCPDSEIIYRIPSPFNGLRDRKGTLRYSKIGCRPKMMIHSFSHAVHCIPPWPSVLLLTLMQRLSKNSGVIQPWGIPYGLLQLKSWQRETSLLVGS